MRERCLEQSLGRGALTALIGFLTLIAGGFFISPAQAAPEKCEQAYKQAQAAGDDIDALRAAAQAAIEHCPGEPLEKVKRRFGAALYKAARTSQTPKELLLEAASMRYDWRIFASLAEIFAAEKDWTRATINYEEALNAINELPPGEAPKEDLISSLLVRATNARGAAAEYVPITRDRSDQIGGVALRSVGGVEIESVALPIEFVVNEAWPTPMGELALDDLIELVKSQQLPAVHLVGHASPEGSDAHNMALSQRRVEYVRAELEARISPPPRVTVEAQGERQPPEVFEPSRFSDSELFQMARRVEMRRM